MRVLALACLLGALMIGVRDLRAARRRGAGERSPAVWRVARWYERSRAGRRLAARLWEAQVQMSPASWRAAQVLVAVPVFAVLAAAGTPLPAAAAGASSVPRIGGAVLLRLRRGAAAAALDDASPVLARALATELGAWGSGGQAITSAAARCEGRAPVVVSRVLQGAAARVILGGDASTSLRRALAESGRVPPRSAAARVAAVFALHRHDSAATAVALERLAAALEDDAAARREARAAVAEVRMSAVAVPVIAGATLVMLLAGDPPVLLAATSMPLSALLGAAVVVVVAASVATRRLVST